VTYPPDSQDSIDGRGDRPGAPRKSLVRCPRCLSHLIYPLGRAEAQSKPGLLIERRCPECGLRDVVVASRLAAAVWYDSEIGVRNALFALADAIESGMPFDAP
jgi:DNA-directed RNA polymerase subunit RPC12/RpoP